MKYMIRRTSTYGEDIKPCEEAYLDKYISIDERIIDDPNKFNCISNRENWYKEGKNHRIEYGHIKRDFKDKAYFIDVDSLEELNKLYNKYGDLIRECWDNPNIPCIEIYDDYRE